MFFCVASRSFLKCLKYKQETFVAQPSLKFNLYVYMTRIVKCHAKNSGFAKVSLFSTEFAVRICA